MDFEPFPKIGRMNTETILTEKLDGTNAQVAIFTDGELYDHGAVGVPLLPISHNGERFWLAAGSRKRWISPIDDNYGFARWVHENAVDLLTLGPGRHYGEWWGQGIQRRYDQDRKRFSLFNVHRWASEQNTAALPNRKGTGQPTPECCDVVPVLSFSGPNAVEEAMIHLRDNGSLAAPGFMNPEGVIAFHTGTRTLSKTTFEYDQGKWAA